MVPDTVRALVGLFNNPFPLFFLFPFFDVRSILVVDVVPL